MGIASAIESDYEKISLNLAVVGGGQTCKFFLELLQKEIFPYLHIRISAVCDINPEAEGYLFAKEMGIFTTNDFRELFKIEGLNFIIELTNNRDVLLELIRLRPGGIGILEHNITRLFHTLFVMNQKLEAAQQQVAFEKEVSHFLFEQTNERIVVLNPDFMILEASESFLNAVGQPKGAVIGARCHEVSHGLSEPCSRYQPDMGCPLMETLRSGAPAHVIHDHPRPDGGTTYCELVTYPLKDSAGQILRVIEIWRDVTDKFSLQVERRVNKVKENLQKLIQEDRMISLGKLVASSVHEINNPIQGLMTFSGLMLDILEQGDLSHERIKDFKKYLSLMSKELERCGNIVSGLLSFSRQSATEYRHVDLWETLKQALTLTKHRMDIQNIHLETRPWADPLIVVGDVNQLQQCFLNLLFNAIEAMPDGGRLFVSSELDRARHEARIIIRDTGHGIPQEIMGHIFDPFFTTKEEEKGTGLGLSIVYGVVKNHKGHVGVDSQVGEGASFLLTFPLA
jgi:two-component system, NtrC family, sensor kinase